MIIRLLLCLVFLTPLTSAKAQEFSKSELKRHIVFLASDSMIGRGPGTYGASIAALYIAGEFNRLGLKAPVPGYFQEFSFRPLNPHGQDDSTRAKVQTCNVLAFLDNQAEKTIVIGAHYDHLGEGFDGNSMEANPGGKIHNGADDNASGVAGLIELARVLSENKAKEKCNFLFAAFSAEEAGLFGSKYLAEHPPVQPSSLKAMFNLDMVGRMDSVEKKLMIYGVGTAAQFVDWTKELEGPIKIVRDSSGLGPSDHASFYLKNIPVIHFFTGQHKQYHKPDDDEALINYDGEVLVLNAILKMLTKAEEAVELKFLPTRNPAQQAVDFKVTLGVMPDYTFDGKGLRIDGVTDGKPASKAGILPGDVILQMGSLEITDIYVYMKALSGYKKGEETQVMVLRKGQQVSLKVVF